MKRIALLIVTLTCCTLLRAAITTTEAIDLLSTSIGKFAAADGLSMKMGIKVPIAPAMDFQVYTRDSLMAIGIDGGKVFFEGNTMWEYDAEENTVEISTLEGNDTKDLVMIGTLPLQFDFKDLKPAGKNSIQTPKATITFDEKDGKVDYHFKADEGNMDIQISRSTKDLTRLKIKKGMITLTITYSNIRYTCSEKEVKFNPANYPTATITDKRQ